MQTSAIESVRTAYSPQHWSRLTTGSPSRCDRHLSEFCQKLFAGAIDAQQFAPAWSVLASLFRASRVQLVRDIAAPGGAVAADADVQPFDALGAHPALPRHLGPEPSEQGLFAIARRHAAGFDAVVVIRHGEPFTQAECAWMELTLGPIATALDLGDQLARPLPTAASAVQLARLFPTPCLLTDESGRCIERNHGFDHMLEALPGGVRGGRVMFDDPQLQDTWRHALLEGGVTAATQSLALVTSTGERWTVHVVPFYCVSGAINGAPRHLMFALFEKGAGADARQRAMPTSRPLTKAELEVLAGLLHGHTAKAIARTRGASVNTVRNQIANILGKTGHHTQKELMASFSESTMRGTALLDGGLRR
jgi:DNA-binding CsgD family transcriptional regulator